MLRFIRQTSIKHIRKLRRSSHGAVLVELAVVLPVLFLLTFGIIQYCVLANATTTLLDISREGARYEAVHATETNADAAMGSYLKNTVCPGTSIPYKDITASVIATDRSAGTPIKVVIYYDLGKKLFMPRTLPGLSGIGVSSRQTTMTIEGSH